MSLTTTERDRSGDGSPGAGATAAANDAADPRLEREVVELRQRLRPICRDWDPAAFEALVLGIARTKVRWADIDSRF